MVRVDTRGAGKIPTFETLSSLLRGYPSQIVNALLESQAEVIHSAVSAGIDFLALLNDDNW